MISINQTLKDISGLKKKDYLVTQTKLTLVTWLFYRYEVPTSKILTSKKIHINVEQSLLLILRLKIIEVINIDVDVNIHN